MPTEDSSLNVAWQNLEEALRNSGKSGDSRRGQILAVLAKFLIDVTPDRRSEAFREVLMTLSEIHNEFVAIKGSGRRPDSFGRKLMKYKAAATMTLLLEMFEREKEDKARKKAAEAVAGVLQHRGVERAAGKTISWKTVASWRDGFNQEPEDTEIARNYRTILSLERARFEEMNGISNKVKRDHLLLNLSLFFLGYPDDEPFPPCIEQGIEKAWRMLMYARPVIPPRSNSK
jgi:hypothetical protein